MRTKKGATYTVLLVAAIAVIMNILSEKYFARLDFTADKQYTLSDATINILENLGDPVTVTAYFSENLPPDIAKTQKDFKALLVEYASISGGMVVYEFVNPNEDEELEKQAQQNGIGPVLINVREKDEVKQQKAYLGALIQMGETQDVIPFMQPGAAMEYDLSSSIKKLSVVDKPSIGLLGGHGEPGLRSYQQVWQGLSVLYNVEELNLTDTSGIDPRFKTIAIVAPKDSFPPAHLYHIDNFLNNGGKLFVAINRVDGNLQNLQGSAINTGLETWLANKGIEVGSNFIVDANCNRVSVRQGNFPIPMQMPFYYLPIINTFTDHPAVKGLESVGLPFASSVNFVGDSSQGQFTALALTSAQSGMHNAPVSFNIQKQWTQNDFPMSNITVAGILEGTNSSKIVVIGDGDFAVNGEGQSAQRLPEDNVNLMVNCIDYLSDDTGLIELRTKGITSRPIDELEDTTKASLKYFNFLLPIMLVVIYGLGRMQMRKTQRMRRMEEDYS